MANKMLGLKSFRFSEEVIDALNKLKEEYHIESDSEVIRKIILEYSQKGSQCEAKDRELKALYIKLGELQGEVNVYKQKALLSLVLSLLFLAVLTSRNP